MSIVCTICQDLVTERPQNLNPTEEIYIIAVTCGHVFHRCCILEWFQKFETHVINGQCPCCKTAVSLNDGIRIYPSGDEESNKIAETLGKAKACTQQNADLQSELQQINQILEETGNQLENEQLGNQIMKYEYEQKEKELDEVRQLLAEKDQFLEKSEHKWKSIVDKLTKEREEAEDKLAVLQKLANDSVQNVPVGNQCVVRTDDIVVRENKSCQTDGRDAALLQARLVSYKSCLLHMESEVRLLEEEYGKLEGQRSAGQSKRNYDSAMMDFPDGDLKKNDCSLDSEEFTSLDCGAMDAYASGSELSDIIKREAWNNSGLSLEEDNEGGLMNVLVDEIGQSSLTDEFADAPLWKVGE